jgi:nucleoside-diphosphate kinase
MNTPQKERTFVFVKHDGIQRSLVGEIIKRIERTGLKIVAMKMFVPDRKRAEIHYGKNDTWCAEKGQIQVENLKKMGIEPTKPAIEYGRDKVEAIINYITVGPVIAMVIEGNQAVGIVKKIVGGTEPLTSDVGTIRGDLTLDSYAAADSGGAVTRAVRNLMHCTGKPEEAEGEINLWFKEDEIINYRLVQEAILYDVNLDGILE